MKLKSLLTIGLSLLAIILFSHTLKTMKEKVHDLQYHNLTQAVQRAITSCYALEGRYPQSLDDLIDTYGLIYDDDTFFIDYQPNGENIRPNVTIIEVKP